MMFICFPLSHLLEEVPYFLTFHYFWSLCIMVLAWLCLMLTHILSENQEYSPQDILGFAYYRSLLQLTITIFGGTHRHAHTNTHAISRCFSLDFIHRHNGLGSEACVCTGALCSVHIQLPLHSWPLPSPSRQLTTVRTGYCIQHLLTVVALRKLFTSPWYDTSFNLQGCTE